jgi:hypothetical protein
MGAIPANRVTRGITRTAFGLCFLAVVVVLIWSTGLLAGWPTLPLASRDGTERVFPLPESQAVAAITNAFERLKYNQMMLSGAVGEDWLGEGWHPTNGFLLLPTLEPVAWIPTKGFLGRRRLPYMAWFHITALPEGTNQTKVNVRTVRASVGDGISLDPHGGGRGSVKVAPVRSEEERVLTAISEQIAREK